MARLDPKPYPGPWASPKWDPVTHQCLVTDWRARWEDEKKALAALDAKSHAIPPGEIVGAVLRWQVADGYAVYIVTKSRPLTLAHVGSGDAYSVDPALIRGLRRQDVLDMLERERRFRSSFPGYGSR